MQLNIFNALEGSRYGSVSVTVPVFVSRDSETCVKPSQVGWCPSQDSNQTSPTYKPHMQCSSHPPWYKQLEMRK
jgi:hypothetical protein